MQEFQRRLDTSDKFEPVAYDRSIRWVAFGVYRLTVRMDGESMHWDFPTLSEAQSMMNEFPPEVYEGLEPLPSVFCSLRKTG
jgi:hypothetical protein